jgi:uncharacterized phage protein (TIGR01671 family)
MREILFRGKVISTNEWTEGNLAVDNIGTAIITPDATPIGKYGRVYPETVGQFTGLLDKNGTKIFEGDFAVLDEDVKKTFNIEDGVIRYGRGGFYVNDFELLNSLNTIATFDGILRGKIIGNIHDNPELLEKEE